MSMRQVAAIVHLLEHRGFYQSFIDNDGRLTGGPEEQTLQSLIQMVMHYSDYDMFLSVVRDPDWQDQASADLADGGSSSLMDIMVSEYIEAYESMTAGTILEITTRPKFRSMKKLLQREGVS